MHSIDLKGFNHEATLLGGQTFSWDRVDNNSYVGIFQDNIMKVQLENDFLSFNAFKDNIEFVKDYFRVDEPYEKIKEIISQDKYVRKAMEWSPNIRLLKQPFEMTVLSYVLSANNSIRMINRSIRLLSELLGELVEFEGKKYSLFPSTKSIADATEETLKKAKIGFRAKYLKQVAKQLLDFGLARKKNILSEEEIRGRLVSMPGIGEKIADCVLVFSCGVNNITPVDVWIKRLLNNLYGVSGRLKAKEYRDWLHSHFGGYGAWAGQFLFEWYRSTYCKEEH